MCSWGSQLISDGAAGTVDKSTTITRGCACSGTEQKKTHDSSHILQCFQHCSNYIEYTQSNDAFDLAASRYDVWGIVGE